MKILATIRKELLLLLRDMGGLAMIFLMPLILVTVMALVQDAPFRDYQDLKFQVLYVNNDKDSLGEVFEHSLREAKNLELVTSVNGQPITKVQAQRMGAQRQIQGSHYSTTKTHRRP
jgi:ABC-2 type transport system permease protein